ncbi:phosphate/phosphite/phosphonate ABC transporter substrate-binding protein [Polynucleobacter sinensis]|uniref:phosphate/phosphite/phosphonate ABC transporter substrate-binding protein n=1 Tax=Polynucleobacter sinensis TaxID=1743157 RepID=UPI0007836D72|nr:phosphate/phosphite/phosphonate ABC transporter substrate-binding protein [Polynucleobacter sinensis]
MKFYKKVFKPIIGCVIYLSTITAQATCLGDQAATKSLKVYIVPQFTATQIYTRWSAVLEQVGKETQQCFDLIVPTSIPQFEGDLLAGKPDFAYMNPYHAVMKWRNHQYIPLVASGDPIFGILAVQKDSRINDLRELGGARVAFPAPNAFAASLLIRATLAKDGVPIEPVYVKTHSNVYRSVIRGDAAAGGGIQSTLMSEPPELKSELRTLMETKRYTSHPFSANARVSEAVRKRVQDAFLAMDKSSSGADLLKGVQLAKPILVSYKTNYQPLEALSLEKFVVKSAE